MPMRWVRQNCGNGLKTQSLSMVRQILGVPARPAQSPVHWMIVNTLTSTLSNGMGVPKEEEREWAAGLLACTSPAKT